MSALDYRDLAKTAIEKIKEMAKNKDSWIYYHKKKNVQIWYRKSKNFEGNVFKFRLSMPYPCSVVWDVMKPSKVMEGDDRSWDKSISKYQVLKICSDDLQIARILSHPAAFGAVSAREFISLFHTTETNNIKIGEDHGTIKWVVAQGISYEQEFPKSKKYVRGFNYPTGYAITPIKSDESKTLVECYLDTDIGGLLPQKVVEAALPSQQIKYLQGVEVECKRRINQ